ncbi:hypothetical protein FRC06_010041, partial [Ceratobasidium sp. 370]
GTPIANNLDNLTAGVAAAGVVEIEQDTQGPTLQQGPATLHEHGEVTPALISPHTPLFVSGHVALAPLGQPALALVPDPAPPAAPSLNADLGADLNPNPLHTTLMGSFHGVGGIQFADEVPENLAAEVPSGQNVQEPTIILEHAMPNEAVFPHAPPIQPFAPVQAMPAVDVDAQPFVPVIDNNPVQQPLLRSLYGFDGIQFEDEGDEDH